MLLASEVSILRPTAKRLVPCRATQQKRANRKPINMKNLKFLFFAVAIGIAVSVSARGESIDFKSKGYNADITAGEVLDDLFNKKGADVQNYKKLENDRLEDEYRAYTPRRSSFSALQDDQQTIQRNANAAVASVNADIASDEKKAELEKQGLWQKPVMASDQGDQATEQFMEAIGGAKAGGAITSGAKAATDQMRDDARDANKDAVRDARQAGTDAARQSSADAAQSSRDNCPRGGCARPGHP
jgi:hypothetical protein